MPILSLGISFRRAPLELLEHLAFTDDDLAKAYRRVQDLPGVDGAVILSTCNRVEVVGEVSSYHAGFLGLKRLLTETRDVSADRLADPLYSHWERDAADHLFAVASGLDSVVVGETQIGSQVREAHRRAGADGAITPSLDALFHAALRASRRVRGETAVGAAQDAFVRTAVDAAESALGTLDGRRAVVVGAGTMAALAVHQLRERGTGPLRILNRSLDRARALAERTAAEPDDLAALPGALAEADLVVSATGAAGLVIHEADVRRATAGRAGPLVLIDLAMPRDVDPAAATLPDVVTMDVFTLRDRIAERGGPADAEIERATAIVSEEVRRWSVRRSGEELAPLIRALRERAERVVRAELDRRASRLGSLSHEEREVVESLARAIAAKMLHDPIVELKERAEPGTLGPHATLLAELLRLELDAPDG